MADVESTVTNTAGEAGQNTNIDFSNFINQIISEKVEKAYNSTYQVAKSNQEKFGLSDEELQLAVDNLKAERAKRANAEIEKYNKTVKELEKANARIAEFENQAKTNKINAEFASLLAKSGVSNQKSIDYISKMAGDLNQFYKEDGSIDSEGINSIISSILTDIPSLKDERKTIYYEQPQANKTAESLEDAELNAAFGLNK